MRMLGIAQDGRDRAGMFCAALMLWTTTCTTAKHAMDVFANRRTHFRLGEKAQVHKLLFLLFMWCVGVRMHGA